MTTTKQLKKFALDAMRLYSMDENCFFDDGLFAAGKTDTFTLEKLSKIFGVEVSEILELNKDAAYKWLKKYPYFALRLQFQGELHNSQFTNESRLITAIFDVADSGNFLEKKYDKEKVYERLICQLKEADKYFPGTFKPDKAIHYLEYKAEDFVDFPQLKDLLTEFFKLTDRHKELFFKAKEQDLTSEEIKEYNFLTSALMAKDCVTPHILYYDVLKKLVPIWAKEKFTEYKSFVNIHSIGDFEPWRCKQFMDDRKLAQRYVDVYPLSKKQMLDFYMRIKYIYCTFRWEDPSVKERTSDWTKEEWEKIADDAADECAGCLDTLLSGNIDVSDVFESKLPFEEVYITKTAEELAQNDSICAKKLGIYTGSSKMGGLVVSMIEKGAQDSSRMISHLKALREGVRR